MNMVSSLATINILSFLVLVITGGLLASPTVGFTALLVLPLFTLCTLPLFQGMRTAPGILSGSTRTPCSRLAALKVG